MTGRVLYQEGRTVFFARMTSKRLAAVVVVAGVFLAGCSSSGSSGSDGPKALPGGNVVQCKTLVGKTDWFAAIDAKGCLVGNDLYPASATDCKDGSKLVLTGDSPTLWGLSTGELHSIASGSFNDDPAYQAALATCTAG